jgi:hypothetical protein
MVDGPVQLLLVFVVCVLIALFSYWLIFGSHPDWSKNFWVVLFIAAIGFPACGVVFLTIAAVLWMILSGMTKPYLR